LAALLWLASQVFSIGAGEGVSPSQLFMGLCADAVANSPARRDMEDALRQAEHLQRLSILSLLPTLSGGVGRDVAHGTSFDSRFAYRVQLSLRQILWDGGRWAGARQAGTARIRRMHSRLAAEERSAGIACMALILETLRAGETLLVREKHREYLSLERERLSLRRAMGILLESEYEQALIAIDEALLERERARIYRDECLARLALVVGRSVTEDIAHIPVGVGLNPAQVPVPDEPSWESRDTAVLDALLFLEEAGTALRLAAPEVVPLLHFEGGLEFAGEGPPFSDISLSATLSLSLAGPLVQSTARAGWRGNRTGAESLEQGVQLSTVADGDHILARRSAETALYRAREALERARAGARISMEGAQSQWAIARRALSVTLRRLAWEEGRQREARLLLESGHVSTGDWLSQEFSLEEARIAALDARFDMLLAALELAPSLEDIACFLSFPPSKGVEP
jgi:outer membrane protein TolC